MLRPPNEATSLFDEVSRLLPGYAKTPEERAILLLAVQSLNEVDATRVNAVARLNYSDEWKTVLAMVAERFVTLPTQIDELDPTDKDAVSDFIYTTKALNYVATLHIRLLKSVIDPYVMAAAATLSDTNAEPTDGGPREFDI